METTDADLTKRPVSPCSPDDVCTHTRAGQLYLGAGTPSGTNPHDIMGYKTKTKPRKTKHEARWTGMCLLWKLSQEDGGFQPVPQLDPDYTNK